jgi:hypothetical protein
MGKKANEPSSDRGYREYFWFALTLIILSVCTAGQRISSGNSSENMSVRAAPISGVEH